MTINDQEIILDSINEGVFTIDLDWRITSFNIAAEEITGVSRREAIGMACCDVFHADICEQACSLGKTMETGEPVANSHAKIFTGTGEQIPIRISTAILRNEKGNIVGGVETFQDLSQVEELRKELEARYTFEDIVGRSHAMTQLFELIPQISDSNSTVLIEGPSGTGKELFARAIHNRSPRSGGPFIAVNCAALPDTLLESELFGHKAGAFTDAKYDKHGRFMLADGGTIFLDEIGDISPAMQVRLLRVLQERCVEPLGGVKPVNINVRVIAATNRRLAELTNSGEFREDLYYRIRVIHLELPELAKRREDIPLLVDHHISKFNRLQGKDIAGLSPDAMSAMMEHDYSGNVRELANIIEQAFVLCRGDLIDQQHLPREMRGATSSTAEKSAKTLKSVEKAMIVGALQSNHGNRRRAAKELGIDVSTLYRKIKSLKIPTPETDGRNHTRA